MSRKRPGVTPPKKLVSRPFKLRDIAVTRGEERYRFSAGAVVEALQSAGVPTEEAIELGRELAEELRSRRSVEVPLPDLRAFLVKGVRERVSDEAAERLLGQTPPFVPIQVGDRGETLTRRRLSSSLEKLGLGFKDAHSVATLVEQGIRNEGLESLDQGELARRVALALEGRFGRETRLRYEMATSTALELRVRGPGGDALPYSRGILAQSLMAIGLAPDLSHNIAKRAETALYASGASVVPRDLVREHVVRLLKREAGEEFAQRYLTMREARRRERPMVVLFGGAPGVGKSALASEVGYRLGVTRVASTDSVRQALRSLIGPDLSPVLHSSTYDAWRAELLPGERDTATPERLSVLRGFLAQVNQLKPALAAIVERSVLEATHLIMEGVQLVPGVPPTVGVPGATVIPIILHVADVDDHRRHFAAREGQTGARRARHTYLEHFTEIRILQEYLIAQANVHNVPVVEAGDFDKAAERCLDHVLDILSFEERHQDEPPAAE